MGNAFRGLHSISVRQPIRRLLPVKKIFWFGVVHNPHVVPAVNVVRYRTSLDQDR